MNTAALIASPVRWISRPLLGGLNQMPKRIYDSATYRKNRATVLKAANYVCCICGGLANTADHIVPKSDPASTNRVSNLRAMCLSCNSSRGNKIGRPVRRFTRINNKWF